jgi:hypothetical protein
MQLLVILLLQLLGVNHLISVIIISHMYLLAGELELILFVPCDSIVLLRMNLS